jgi:predicted N-acetyltransferase YhbS
MLQIRQMRGKDISFAIRLTDQEKWGVTRSTLQRLMRLNPRGCFIAYDGKKRVGLTTATTYGKRLAWIGNVIVDKDHRGKRIGQSLVRHAVAFLHKSNVSQIALYCFKEHREFYENLGFDTAGSFVRLRRKAGLVKDVGNQAGFQEPPSLTRMMAADEKAFGADRSRLIRDLLDRKEAWCVASFRGGSSISYLMVRESSEDCEFGPWVCMSHLSDEPREMIKRALAMTRPVPVEVSCLRSNRRALQTFKDNGFLKVREGYRMFFGEKVHIGDDSSQYALGFLDKG